MNNLDQLTDEQQSAVDTSHRVFMLLAPAGSGKTRVLINRIIKILTDSPNESFRILAVAYTVKATNEIRERISKTVGDQIWRVDAYTMHSFALHWLRSQGNPVGVPPDVVVYEDDVDRFAILQRYLDTLGEPTLDSKTMKKIFTEFDNARTGNYSSDSLSNRPAFSYGTNASLREMYEAYLSSLREQEGIDFPGMLYQFHELLEKEPSVVSLLQRVYRHILVDECQDLTNLQSKVLKTIVGNKLHLFVVGDERQSINAWAGGGIEHAYGLVGPKAKKQNLSYNFRCARNILNLTQKVAEHFVNYKNNTVSPVNTPPGQYGYIKARNEEDESMIVTKWIDELLNKGFDSQILAPGEHTKVNFKDIGIIGRNKYVLDKIHSDLKTKNIPLSILTETHSMLITPEARLLLALIELKHRPKSWPAIRRASQELHNQEVHHSEHTDENNIKHLWYLASEEFPAVVSIANDHSLDQMIDHLREVSINKKGWEDDREIILEWSKMYRASTRVNDRSLDDLIYYILKSQRTRPTDPGVRLLTAHQSKGLEFRAVAVVGLNQGQFPDYRNSKLPELDEERRAFYVSIARASRCLLLTRPHMRTYRSGVTKEQEPSQFLREAGIL